MTQERSTPVDTAVAYAPRTWHVLRDGEITIETEDLSSDEDIDMCEPEEALSPPQRREPLVKPVYSVCFDRMTEGEKASAVAMVGELIRKECDRQASQLMEDAQSSAGINMRNREDCQKNANGYFMLVAALETEASKLRFAKKLSADVSRLCQVVMVLLSAYSKVLPVLKMSTDYENRLGKLPFACQFFNFLEMLSTKDQAGKSWPFNKSQFHFLGSLGRRLQEVYASTLETNAVLRGRRGGKRVQAIHNRLRYAIRNNEVGTCAVRDGTVDTVKDYVYTVIVKELQENLN